MTDWGFAIVVVTFLSMGCAGIAGGCVLYTLIDKDYRNAVLAASICVLSTFLWYVGLHTILSKLGG